MITGPIGRQPAAQRRLEIRALLIVPSVAVDNTTSPVPAAQYGFVRQPCAPQGAFARRIEHQDACLLESFDQRRRIRPGAELRFIERHLTQGGACICAAAADPDELPQQPGQLVLCFDRQRGYGALRFSGDGAAQATQGAIGFEGQGRCAVAILPLQVEMLHRELQERQGIGAAGLGQQYVVEAAAFVIVVEGQAGCLGGATDSFRDRDGVRRCEVERRALLLEPEQGGVGLDMSVLGGSQRRDRPDQPGAHQAIERRNEGRALLGGYRGGEQPLELVNQQYQARRHRAIVAFALARQVGRLLERPPHLLSGAFAACCQRLGKILRRRVG